MKKQITIEIKQNSQWACATTRQGRTILAELAKPLQKRPVAVWNGVVDGFIAAFINENSVVGILRSNE